MSAERLARPAPAGVRPRYGRMAALSASVLVTLISVLAGSGALPGGGSASYASAADAATLASGAPERSRPGAPAPAGSVPGLDAAGTARRAEESLHVPVPDGSGEGRRIVFDMTDQRVWLVGADGAVQRTYLVSGSVYDNLGPGTFEVYSRSAHATGVDESGTMRFMVRFTRGDTGAAIGFHSIPRLDGRPVQSRAELGTPQSHGCIRQRLSDARALWRFAPVGTAVVVTA